MQIRVESVAIGVVVIVAQTVAVDPVVPDVRRTGMDRWVVVVAVGASGVQFLVPVCIRIEVVVTCAVAVDVVVPGVDGIRVGRGIGIIAVIAAMGS